MTIPSAYVIKGVGDKLTSGDANTVNTNIQMALDKRSGQTDTLAAIISCGGSGRIVDTYAAATDATPTTYLLSGANSIINASGITAARTMILSNTGAVAGDRLMILNPSSFIVTVQNAAASTIAQLGPDVLGGNDSTWADFLFNGTAWIVWRSAKPAALASTTFNVNGTWTCPRGITLALLSGFGGGGGGGRGISGVTLASSSATGGGGGGGATLFTQLVSVTPGTTYNVTIGAGGAGGVGGNGGDGGDTLFDVLATFRGAQGGLDGLNSSTATNTVAGGATISGVPAANQGAANRTPGAGGMGGNFANANPGNPSLESSLGGAQGTNGTNVGAAPGGGGGGGGGGGPVAIRPGGAGGAGGAGSTTGNGGAGANGAAGNAQAGNGGGGGGAGGNTQAGGAFVPGAGGNGGAGGSGSLTVVPLR